MIDRHTQISKHISWHVTAVDIMTGACLYSHSVQPPTPPDRNSPHVRFLLVSLVNDPAGCTVRQLMKTSSVTLPPGSRLDRGIGRDVVWVEGGGSKRALAIVVWEGEGGGGND